MITDVRRMVLMLLLLPLLQFLSRDIDKSIATI
jgi:hypothetical protein